MTAPVKNKSYLRTIMSFVISCLVLFALTGVAYYVISGGGMPAIRAIPKLLTGGNGNGDVVEFAFETGKNRVFAELEGAFLSAGTLGIQMYDGDGELLVREPYQMTTPAVCAVSGRAAAFDIGGTQVRTFDSKGVRASINMENDIYSASINRNGWFCVITKETGGYTSSVTVFNQDGEDTYKSYSGQGYILQAVLSGDNRSMAALILRGGGSSISLYNLNNETATAVFALDGGLIVDIKYLNDGKILAVTTESLIIVDKNGEGEIIYSFDGRYFAGYTQEGTTIALYLRDFSLGSNGSIISLRTDGTVLGTLRLDRKIISQSLKNGMLVLLTSDGLTFYDRELSESYTSDEIVTVIASCVLALDRDRAFVAGDYSATVMTAMGPG